MGPISDSQLSLAPPCWMVQVDLFGPINVYVPGFERNTRNRKVLEAQCWVMTAVCPTTRLVNLQTMESSKAAGWLDAFIRLSCEVGTPKHVFVDQDSAGMSAFRMAEVELRDLKLRLHREKGISFSVCGVGGHDRHGHVERVIRSLQESLADCGLGQKILHATGLQTLCKMVESQYNNLPIGFHYSRAADNTPLLKILTPNMLRTGRVNQRSMDGPVKLPDSRKEILKQVEETYIAWFNIWLNTLVPKLMFIPKWFKTDKDLEVGNLVYFKKDPDTAFDTKWVIGVIDDVTRGRDGLIRMVRVKYFNGLNNTPQFTDRTIRKLVKLWSVDDISLADDIAEMTRKFGDIPGLETAQAEPDAEDLTDMTGDAAEPFNHSIVQGHDEQPGGEDQIPAGGQQVQAEGADELQDQGHVRHVPDQPQHKQAVCKSCCCAPHHQYSLHYTGKKFVDVPTVICEGGSPSLAAAYAVDTQAGLMVNKQGGLEEVMMSVGLDIDILM